MTLSRTKTRRKWLYAAGLSLAGMLLLWVLLPLWLPVLLRPIGNACGMQYREYSHDGLRRVVLRGLSFTNASVRIQAESVASLAPAFWLPRLWAGRPPEIEPVANIRGWSVEILPAEPARKAGGSTYTNVANVATVLRQLRRWVPATALANGTVQAPGFSLTLPVVHWRNGVLDAEATIDGYTHRFGLQADFRTSSAWNVQGHLEPAGVAIEAKISVPVSKGRSSAAGTHQATVELKGHASWMSNRLEFSASFAAEGQLPKTASARCERFQIPPALVGLDHYSDIFGSFSAEWRDEQYRLRITAQAVPEEDWLPPADVALSADGNTERAVLRSVTIALPWLTAELSKDLEVHFAGKLIREPGFLNVRADLAGQRWVPVSGEIEGTAELMPDFDQHPDVTFRLRGREVSYQSLRASLLQAVGSFNWPALDLSEVNATFSDGSSLTAVGNLNLQEKAISGGQLTFRGPMLKQWLPDGWSYDSLLASAQFSGRLDALRHQGRLDAAGFGGGALRPMRVSAEWSGQQTRLTSLRGEFVAGDSMLSLDASLELTNRKVFARLDSLSLSTNRTPLLELESPCPVQISLATNRTQVTLGDLKLSGQSAALRAQGHITWPTEGSLLLSGRNLHSALARDFLRADLAGLSLRTLAVQAGWTNGPLTGRLDLDAAFAPPQANGTNNATLSALTSAMPPAGIAADIHLQVLTNAVAVSNLTIGTTSMDALLARGFLPVDFRPGSERMLTFLRGHPLSFVASAGPSAFCWERLARFAKLDLADPTLNLELSGTWEAPVGRLDFRAGRISTLQPGARLPPLADLHLEAQVTQTNVQASALRFRLREIPVEATGELPLEPDLGSLITERRLPKLTNATGSLRITEGDMAFLAELYPKLLAPQGKLWANLALQRGGKLQGEALLATLRTQPLPGLGPMRDITASIRFQDFTASATANASIGGAPVYLTGSIQAEPDWFQGRFPSLHVTCRGTNVPLSRQPASILRADLDLALLKTNGAPPILSGTTTLRDSFLLSDLRDLLPGGASAPAGRPPYFSIDEPGLADWRLAVRAVGERFLKVRSPVFSGEISANLVLQGTLREPTAVGDLRVDSGQIRFPFATMEIQAGLLTAQSQDPYRPKLSVTAATKQFGYELKMEVTGSAENPLIQFSSTPPLSSEQIVLMITAGEMPREHQLFTTSQRAQSFALFLGRDLLSQLGFSDQAEDRLTIRSGEQISEGGSPTYSIEYRFSPRWSLTGEYDRFDDYNAGLKWRVYSK